MVQSTSKSYKKIKSKNKKDKNLHTTSGGVDIKKVTEDGEDKTSSKTTRIANWFRGGGHTVKDSEEDKTTKDTETGLY